MFITFEAPLKVNLTDGRSVDEKIRTEALKCAVQFANHQPNLYPNDYDVVEIANMFETYIRKGNIK